MNESVDRIFVAWLQEGPERGPAEGLRRALAATHRTPQRPGWTIPERWLPMQLAMRPAMNPRPFLLVLMAALLAIAATAALLVAGSPRRPAPPAGLAGNGAIVVGVGTELWLANTDGSNARRLDIGLGQSTSPVFSPDGTKVAFMTRVGAATPYSLFVANADGTGARSLTGDMKVVTYELAGITWSPDGRTLVFASSDAGTDRLYLVGIDGGAPVALTDEQSNRAWPAWSPDGAWLAYQGKPTSVRLSLMISRPDGSGERALASVEAFNSSFAGPQWAADSQRIAYFRSVTGPHVVAFVDLEGKETVVSLPGEDAVNPVWSPDGRFLAYSVMTTGGVVVDMADQTKRILIPRLFSDCGMAWAPDGTELLGLDAACTGVYRIPLADPRAATRIGLPEAPINNAAWQRTAPYSGTER
jgi:Tol biopolymer transport system component